MIKSVYKCIFGYANEVFTEDIGEVFSEENACKVFTKDNARDAFIEENSVKCL